MRYTVLLFIVGLLFTSCATAYYYRDARIGNTKNVRSFLQKHPELINKPDHFGNTALILSVDTQKIETATALIELGADVNYEIKSSQTPLRIAIAHNNKAMVELLIKSGADINKANIYGWTPLMTAAEKGYLPIVKLLVASGVNLYAKTKKEYTASALALKSTHTHVYEYLSSLMTAENFRDIQPKQKEIAE